LQLAEAGLITQYTSDVVDAQSSTVFTGAAAKHSWVYSIREEDTLNMMAESTINSLLNVFERKSSENEKASKLLLKSESLSETENQLVAARQLAEDYLEAAIQPLDQAFMILTEI